MPFNTGTGEYIFIPPVDPETNSSQAILGDSAVDEPGLLDDALEEFLSKNDDYEDASDALGLTGQVADLWRKIVKLKKAVIDGGHLNGETVPQLIRDIFGHSLLAMYYDENRKPAAKTQTVQQTVVNAEAPVLPNRQALHELRMALAKAREYGNSWENLKSLMAAAQESEKPAF